MGYYTTYALTVKQGDPFLIPDFITSNKEAAYALQENGYALQESKWYEHEQDLKKFSKEHPDTLFELSGQGEDSGDIWKKYFKGGKMQVCKAQLTIDPFDENKLM